MTQLPGSVKNLKTELNCPRRRCLYVTQLPCSVKNLKTELSLKSRLGGLVVSALDFQAGYRGFESRSGRDNFQTISTPSSYSTCPGLSIKWTGRRLVTDSGTKCAWVIHESKAVQIHVHNNRRCLYVPRGCLVALKSAQQQWPRRWRYLYVTQLPGSVKNLN